MWISGEEQVRKSRCKGLEARGHMVQEEPGVGVPGAERSVGAERVRRGKPR